MTIQTVINFIPILATILVLLACLLILAHRYSPEQKRKTTHYFFWSRMVIGDLPLIFLFFIAFLPPGYAVLIIEIILGIKILKRTYRTPRASL